MSIGISLVDQAVPISRLAELGAAAERLGYQTIWTNDAAGRDPFVVLGAWAGQTSHARLGVGVVPIYARPPLTSTGAAASLVEFGDRRVVLGVGVGHTRTAAARFGTSYPSPLAALREYVTIARRLLAGQEVDAPGPVFPLKEARLPRRSAISVPVVIGAMGPKALASAVETADGVLLNWTPAAELERLGLQLRGDAPRPFEVSAYVRVAVHEDVRRARAAVAADLASYVRVAPYRDHLARLGYPDVAEAVTAAWARDDPDAAAAALSDEVVDHFAVVSTPAECRHRLEPYLRAGIDEVVVRPVPVDEGLLPVLEAAAPGAGTDGTAI